MKAVPDEPRSWKTLSPPLRDSWHRSAQYLSDPGRALAPVTLSDEELNSYRASHPLRHILPVLDRLLIQPAAAAGLIVAIGDAAGRLLWVDGDRMALRQAESAAFRPGATWSEEAIGTSAPGVALATGRGAQVHREEHFAVSAHQFSCSAAPLRHPGTGRILGVVDLTGDEQAVATHSLPLVCAAVTAAQAELRHLPESSSGVRLSALGTARPRISCGPASEVLSLRHAEILTLVAWHWAEHQRGLSAGELSELLFGQTGHEVTLRAEIVRLRRFLRSAPAAAGLDLHSRPYRFSAPVELDALTTLEALTAGDRLAALQAYQGPVLPDSDAPGIRMLRRHVSETLREAVLSDGSSAELCRYLQLSEAAGDPQVLYAALRALPADSPQRAALVAGAHTGRW